MKMRACEKAGLVFVAMYALLVASWTGEALKIKECAENDYLRLPKRIQPEHYDLEIFVDPDALAFTGQVNIHVRHHENSDSGACDKLAATGKPKSLACDRSTIILDVYDTMKITGIEYEEIDSKATIPWKYVCRLTDQDAIVIGLAREPAQGSAGELRISYQAEVNEDFAGLFRAEARDSETGKSSNVSATNFEPGFARRAFPCFDEPEFKATYELAIFHPSNLRAISNTPVASIEEHALAWPGKDFSKTTFGRTPKMSSYLLAFAVGKFDYIESKVDDKMTIRMYTPPGRAHEAQAQMKTAVQSYKLLREFFGVEQPISKLDFVTIRDFPSAMENWGMVVIEESLLLLDRDQLDADHYNYARDSLIHEISHQWFGNLVTMKWWDDLWLNEGFAQWMGTEISDQLNLQAGANSMWMLIGRRMALDMDANQHKTHPIKNPALKTVGEIEETFDSITYHKGQSVIKMLDKYLGHETFHAGLRAYIRKYAYGNIEDTDLWQSLAETSGADVRDLMRNWLYQPGFPLIAAKLGSKGKLELTQTRFGAPKSNQKWIVPIDVLLSDGADRLEQVRFVLSERSGKFELPDWFDIKKPGHWLKLNADSVGFYYTHYDGPLYAALQRPIETKTMPPDDRYNILQESLGEASERVMTQDDFIKLLKWLEHEDDDAVVALICVALDEMGIDYDDYPQLFSSLVSHLERHGLEDETSDEASLMKLYARGTVLYTLVDSNYKPAIRAALKLFATGKVPGFLQDGVNLAVGRAGTDEQFNQMIGTLAKYNSRVNKIKRMRHLLNATHGLSKRRDRMVRAI